MTTPGLPRLLAGSRVIDLPWILVGTGATRLLASIRAEVIGIEPTDTIRVDLARYAAPFIPDTPALSQDSGGMSSPRADGFERAAYYCHNTDGQRGMRRNVYTPEGTALFRHFVTIGKANKRRVTLDRGTAEGRELVRYLVPRANLVVDATSLGCRTEISAKQLGMGSQTLVPFCTANVL